MDFKKLLNKLTVLGGAQVLNESMSTVMKTDQRGNQVTEDESIDDLNIGDDVIITGPVEFEGKTGVVDSFGQNKDFVVVNLYNHGKHSFQASDVSLNDYADSDDEQERMSMREGSNDYFKRRKDEESRIAGTKAPAKNKPKQTDYEKKRKEEKKVMGEASKPDFLDIDKDGDKKEPMKKAAADKKADVKESTLAELIAKMDVIIGEAAKPDFLDVDKDGDKKEPMKKAAADKKKQGVAESSTGAIEAYGVRGMNSKQWRKTFKSQAAFEAWLAKNEGDVEVHGTRKLVGGVAESKLAECGGMSYDQDSGMSINTSVDTRTGSKTVSVTASGNSADDLMQMLKLAGMGSESQEHDREAESSSIKVVSVPLAHAPSGFEMSNEQEVDETYANEPNPEIQPVDTQLRQGNDLNKEKSMFKHGYRNGDNPMAMHEARELARLEKEIKEGIDSIKVKQPEHSGHRSAASAGSADSYYGRARKPNKSKNGVKIFDLTPKEIEDYNKAYDENEELQNFKDWGRGR